MLIEFNEKKEDLNKILAKGTVLIDFWAPWCTPCLMMKPIIEAMAKKPAYKDITFIKINVDENRKTAEKFGIMSIPAFFIFKNGEKKGSFIGTMSEEEISEKLR